jgi:hypothetical protein
MLQNVHARLDLLNILDVLWRDLYLLGLLKDYLACLAHIQYLLGIHASYILCIT